MALLIHPDVRSLLRLALAAVALCPSLAACGNDDSGGEERVLEVGYAFGFDVGDTGDRVAFARLAERSDIEPTFTETGGGQEAIAALVRGDIDVANVQLRDAVTAIEGGADIRVVLTSVRRSDILIASLPEFERLAQLRGQKVLLTAPGPSSALARLALARAGLQEGDYEVEFLPDSANRIAALASDRTEAADIEFVDLQLARQDTELNMLADLGALNPEPFTVFAVTADFAEENGPFLEEFVRQMLRGYESLYGPAGEEAWVERAREEHLADQSEQFAQGIYRHHRDIEYWPREDSPYSEAQHDRAVAFYVETGALERPLELEEVWDNSYWRAAAGGG